MNNIRSLYLSCPFPTEASWQSFLESTISLADLHTVLDQNHSIKAESEFYVLIEFLTSENAMIFTMPL